MYREISLLKEQTGYFQSGNDGRERARERWPEPRGSRRFRRRSCIYKWKCSGYKLQADRAGNLSSALLKGALRGGSWSDHHQSHQMMRSQEWALAMPSFSPAPELPRDKRERRARVWMQLVTGKGRRGHPDASSLPQLLGTCSPALTSSPKRFAALLLLLRAAFVFLGIPGRAVLLQMVTRSAISGHQLDWTSPAHG